MHSTNYVYWGTIATDKLLGVLPFGQSWMDATTMIATVPPTEGRDVKFRIYNDFESLRSFQELSARKAREEAWKTNA